MGSDIVVPLAGARERRAARDRARVISAARHPALRWVAGDTYWVAHRRDQSGGGAWCGMPGALTLAPPGVPLCPDCYPDVPDPSPEPHAARPARRPAR